MSFYPVFLTFNVSQFLSEKTTIQNFLWPLVVPGVIKCLAGNPPFSSMNTRRPATFDDGWYFPWMNIPILDSSTPVNQFKILLKHHKSNMITIFSQHIPMKTSILGDVPLKLLFGGFLKWWHTQNHRFQYFNGHSWLRWFGGTPWLRNLHM